ncbi:hypothetical protein [Verminephrobacter aporrectodeae]|uniref:hypothetical protein n=1 Tax=Verminephrobacter aporrectodeae TaxID=1110389 RepID=UPI002238A5FD|nr:hypothetical protein [Verminephrobacter aporrectodeae]
MDNITETIAERVAQDSKLPGILHILSRQLQPTDLQSLLLSVYEQRAQRLSARDVLRRARQQPMVQASTLDQRTIVALDQMILAAIDPAFEAVELSPLCPFGLNTVVASTSQKKILSTVRNNEVLSDLGTALALEACNRRTRVSVSVKDDIRLCSSHRAVRAQAYPAHFGFTAHFRIFGMLSANKQNSFNHGFVSTALCEHIHQYLLIFGSASRQGYHIADLTVTISDMTITEALMDKHKVDRKSVCARTLTGQGRLFDDNAPFATTLESIDQLPLDLQRHYGIIHQSKRLARIAEPMLKRLACEFPHVRVQFALDRISGIGHYKDICFKIDGANAAGQSFPLVDGGTTNWMEKLLANRQERCFVSGVGSELFCRLYRARPVQSSTPNRRCA